MVVQSARAVKTDRRNAREMGERGWSPIFPAIAPFPDRARLIFAWLALLLSESLAEAIHLDLQFRS